MTKNYDQFNYSLTGSKNKPVILFLHGFMGNCDDFKEVIALVSNQFCCLTIDLPGHGQTKVQQDEYYTMEKTAQALIELLQKLDINQCFLVGYSLGGRIALYLTIYFPQYFNRVILESASPGLVTLTERNQRIKQDLKLAEELESIELIQFLNKWYSNPLFASFTEHPQFQKALTRKLNNDPLKLAKSLRNIGTGIQPSLWKQLSSNQVPLMLLVGELDQKFIAINHQIANLCAQAQLNIVQNSGHNIHFEYPLELAKTIDFFFKET